MDNFFTFYRDPLFGLIVLFLIIFSISLLHFLYNTFKDKDQELRRFLKGFEGEYKLNQMQILEALIIAKNYQGFLELAKDENPSARLFYLQAFAWYKLGVLGAAISSLEMALSRYPRKDELLRFLLFLYLKIGDSKGASNVISSLLELGISYKACVLTKTKLTKEQIAECKVCKAEVHGEQSLCPECFAIDSICIYEKKEANVY